MLISLDVHGNAPGVLRTAPGRLERAGVLAVKRMAEDYTGAVHDWIDAGRAFTPRSEHGAQQGIDWRPTRDGAEVYANAAHSGYLEYGTEPHVIRPRPGRKALRFFGAGGGVVIRRSVNHPGTDPMPFFFADLEGRKRTLLGTARDTYAEVLGG